MKKLVELGKNDKFIAYSLGIPISAVPRAKDGAVSQIMKCEHCGKEILRLHTRQKWCSDECKYAARELRKKDRPAKHCIVCGNILDGQKRYFCSEECKKIKHTSELNENALHLHD